MSRPKKSKLFLPSLHDLITVLENISETRDISYVNLFITCLAGYAVNMWLGGLIDPEELRNYFNKLYEALISGSYELDREVIEIIAALGNDVINEALYEEIMNKIVMISKDLI